MFVFLDVCVSQGDKSFAKIISLALVKENTQKFVYLTILKQGI